MAAAGGICVEPAGGHGKVVSKRAERAHNIIVNPNRWAFLCM